MTGAHTHGYAGDLTPAQAWEALDNDGEAILVDVRTPQEWREVGIPDLSALGSDVVLNPVQTQLGRNPDFLQGLLDAGLAPGDNRTVIFVCKAGGRSLAAAQIATQAGFGPAYNVLEGYEGATSHEASWSGGGLPITAYEGDR